MSVEKLQPDGNTPNRRLGLHGVNVESGESVNDSKLNSRVIWLAQGGGAGTLEVLTSTTGAMVSFEALIA